MTILTRMPGTCSLMNMTSIHRIDTIEADCQAAFARDLALGDAARMSGILGVVTRRDFVLGLQRKGFKEIAKYDSHNHRTVCSLMFRKITEREFNSKKLSFPKPEKKK